MTTADKLLWAVRYGLPGALLLAAIVIWVAGDGDETATHGAILFLGAAIAVALLNVLHRTGVTGDKDREAEDAAREYFDRHGRWPDEEG